MSHASSGRASSTVIAVYGALVGVLAYVVGYLLTYATTAGAVTRAVRGNAVIVDAGAPFAPTWKAVGWVFYDAHFVGTSVPGMGRLVDFAAVAGVQFVYLVVPLLLVLAGGAVAVVAGADGVKTGATAGAAILAGYLLFSLVGALLVSFVRIQPDLLRAAFIAGVCYPAVFGAIGGGLVGVLRAERRVIATA